MTDGQTLIDEALNSLNETPSTDVSENSTLEETSSTDTNSSEVDENQEPEQTLSTEEESSQEETEPTEDEKIVEEPKEEVIITKSGKRLKVNYDDKAKIKRAYLMAAGMRDFQKERDNLKEQLADKDAKISEQNQLWERIDQAAKTNNLNELMKIMTGGTKDFDTVYQQRRERELLKENATDEEIALMERDDKINQLESKLSDLTEKLDKTLSTSSEKLEEAQISQFTSKVESAFDKHRFYGNLGDPDLELKLDNIMWENAVNKLNDYDSSEITPELVVNEFKTIKEVLSKVADKKANSQIKEATTKRKAEAKKIAAVQQTRGVNDNDLKTEVAKHLQDRDVAGIFSNWDKFSKLF